MFNELLKFLIMFYSPTSHKIVCYSFDHPQLDLRITGNQGSRVSIVTHILEVSGHGFIGIKK